MKRILLVCNAGMSTTLLVTKMQEASKEMNVDCEIWSVSTSDANANFEKADVCLLGPQVRFMKSLYQKQTTIPVDSIDMVNYGKMDGKATLNQALDLLK